MTYTSWCGKCSLPLLPSEDIPHAFRKLQEKNKSVDQRLSTFFVYVETTWMESDIWPIESWSVFGRSVRTNNDVEGWHAGLNRRAKKGNLPFYLLLDLLYREARVIRIQVKLVKERKLQRQQRKRTTEVQGRLFALWDDYAKKERSARSLLDACSRLYGPV